MTIATIAQIILVMLLWAACFPLIAAGLAFAPHLTFAALRAIIAGMALIAVALALGRRLPRGRRVWAMVAIIGVGATSLAFLGMFHAAEFISPGIATVIASTQPLLAAMLAGVVLGERLTASGKAGLVLGFLGIVVIVAPRLLVGEQENYLLGVVYIVMAALGVTVSNVLIKRIAGSIDALMAMGLQMLIGSIPLLLGAWAVEEPAAIRWTLTFVAALLALSLFGTALVYWLWISVLERVPLNRANAFSFLIPIFGLTMGALFYGETLGWTQLVGITLTILGIGLVAHRGTERGIAGDPMVDRKPREPRARASSMSSVAEGCTHVPVSPGQFCRQRVSGRRRNLRLVEGNLDQPALSAGGADAAFRRHPTVHGGQCLAGDQCRRAVHGPSGGNGLHLFHMVHVADLDTDFSLRSGTTG